MRPLHWLWHHYKLIVSTRYRQETWQANHPSQHATTTLTGGQTLHNVHTPTACTGSHCCIHNPSDHHMKHWPQTWRSDRRLMERTCPHGIGHPDPDHMAHVFTQPSRVDEYDPGIHGCDGCCRAPSRHALRDVAAEFGIDLDKG